MAADNGGQKDDALPGVSGGTGDGAAGEGAVGAGSSAGGLIAGASGFSDGFTITNSQRDELAKIQLPPHQLQFDEKELRELLIDSVSLSFNEKEKILSAIGNLTQEQVDELLVILREEKGTLSSFDKKHRGELEEIDRQVQEEERELARELEEKLQKEKDSETIRKIREELLDVS